MRSRQQRGNMLILACISIAFVALLMVLGASFGGLAFIHNRLQSSADEIALAGARKLNDMDRLGQMNNMLARSRQLVHAQEMARQHAETESDPVQHLADQLQDEATDNAHALEAERKNVLLPVCRAEALTAMQEKYLEMRDSYKITLPWLKVSALQLPMGRFGEIADVESPVLEMTGQDDLAPQDRSDSLVKVSAGGGVNLYKHHRNHHLHGPHSYLAFQMSSLPAPINKVISPARAVLSSEFVPISDDYLPSAAQVRLTLDVETGLGGHATSHMVAIGSAAATGADTQQ